MGHSHPGPRSFPGPTRRPYGLLLAVALSAGPVFGQSGPTLGTVVADQVVVRGSPRPDGPDAGTLARGTAIVVHHAEGDRWLAIQPPRGSLSWVNHRFIDPGPGGEEKIPRNAVVTGDRVRLAVGRVGVDRPLDVRWAAVPEGTILKVIGPKVRSADDGQDTFWYPVEPPEDDFRYVPKDAVRLDGPAGAAFAVKSPPQPAAGGRPVVEPASATTPPGKPAGWPSHAVWAQAEAAERAGELDKAERLYFQLAREMNAPGGDADLANLCYTRVHAIRERRRAGADRGVAWTPTPDRRPAAAPAARDADPPRRSEAAPDAAAREKWSGAGTLRRASFRLNGRPAYALEDARGRLLVYAVAADGVDLDRHTRRTVELFGAVQYPGDLRGVGLMTVTKVDPLK
jgi:hypothetical protein